MVPPVREAKGLVAEQAVLARAVVHPGARGHLWPEAVEAARGSLSVAPLQVFGGPGAQLLAFLCVLRLHRGWLVSLSGASVLRTPSAHLLTRRHTGRRSSAPTAAEQPTSEIGDA